MTKKYVISAILVSSFMAGAVMPVFAQQPTDNVVPPLSAIAPDSNVSLACVRTAVEKRENALIAAWDKFAAAIRSAYETRKADLLAAWNIKDPKERRAAILKAWQKFRENKMAARKAWDEARRHIWEQFKKDRIACKHGPTLENPTADAL